MIEADELDSNCVFCVGVLGERGQQHTTECDELVAYYWFAFLILVLLLFGFVFLVSDMNVFVVALVSVVTLFFEFFLGFRSVLFYVEIEEIFGSVHEDM